MRPNRLYRVLYHVNKSLRTRINLGRRGGYLDLIDNVEGICISRIRENNLHQCVCDSVTAVRRSFKGILEVCCGIFNRGMTTKDDKTCNANALILVKQGFIVRVTTYNMRVKTLTMPMPLDSR